ncbi:MAG: histidine kinase dimerization/phospho-acceptor domain-containing protein [Thermoanaerobaculia bacterium]
MIPEDDPPRSAGPTERESLRQALEEMSRAKEAAEAASRAKDQFLATLSHELRTPLAPVLALVTTLEMDERARDFRDELARIRRNVELEARLIDDLLDLTRIARGKLELHPEVADAHKIVEHALQICCQEAIAAGRLRVACRDGGLDLVIGDLGLPDGSGVELMRELSSRYKLPGIALSGYGMEEDVLQSLEAGFRQHLTKPVNLHSLKEALQEVGGEER